MRHEAGFHGPPLGLVLARTAKDVRHAFDSALAEAGGTAPSWHILNALKFTTWRSQRDLARALGIEGPTLTRHVDGLERAGLLRRVADTTDRRVQRLELTEAGAKAHERMVEAVMEFNRRLSAGLNEQELGQLVRSLDRLVANVSQAPSEFDITAA